MTVVLFDVDGVLIDSWAAYRTVWGAWAATHALDADTVWTAIHGRRPEETVRDVAAHLDPTVERLVLDRLVVGAEPQFRAFAGAADLLDGLPVGRWAVVTSGSGSATRERFLRNGLPLPDVLVGGEDVDAGKPDPECFLRAARRLQVAPRAALVVEDSPAGVAAARAATMRVLAVAATHRAEELAAADVVVPDLPAAAELVHRWLAARQ
ncbi:HAD-IA family hydrolase [Modestobacter sp. DSM 44400]|uniref:HAD-IA family hydrolase n=1 Tax=Modestobacter sp. DSM 44400 TaxID=1550230 RepID=UPI000B824342|nr:HAD-IA family hydrolase [Modestobacter sp. DSM 44400]